MSERNCEYALPDALKLIYVPLGRVLQWGNNPKLHDIPKIKDSIRRHGFKDPPKFEPALNGGAGGIVEGNGRMEGLQEMFSAREPLPRGIGVDSDGVWWVPVLFGVDAASQAEASSYGIDHNWLTVAPLGAAATAGMWDLDVMRALSPSLGPDLQPLALAGGDLLKLLTAEGERQADNVKSTGESTTKLRLTMADPETLVEGGEVFELDGRHVLVVVDVVLEVEEWLPWLERFRAREPRLPVLFCPYPDPFAPLGLRGEEELMLLIQPDAFIAGHLIDQFKRIYGEQSVVRLS